MIKKILVPLFLLINIWSCSSRMNNSADLILKNGAIYTMDDSNPNAQAVAVKAGEIIFVGSNEQVDSFQNKKTQVIDLNGKAMSPGLIEGHGHFMGVGYNLLNLDLSETNNYEEIVALVKEEVAKRKAGEWILGRGWHQSKWDVQPEKLIKGFQVHDKLSEISPENPVLLSHSSGHGIFVNAKAMELAGMLNNKTKNEDGGEVIRDQNGNPTGIFNENAMYLINQVVPESTAESNQMAFDLAIKACHELGITSFQDAGVGRKTLDLYKENIDRNNLGVRIYAMISSDDMELVEKTLEKKPEIGLGNGFLTIRSFKIHADGALGSRGAWLLEDYSDRPGHQGMATVSMDHVQEIAEMALENGYQVATHAIGDRTNQEVLDRYELAMEKYPEIKDHRFRIEHAQHLNLDDIPRFGELGVIAAMQAVHMSSDRPWAIDRLGEKRIVEGAYVWRKLLNSGAVIVNGTDAPVEPLNPIPSFYASVSRKTLKGEPEGGYESDQKMTRLEALRSYTLDAAYGAFQEDILGSIEVGKLADFTVYDRDIMKVPESEILGTKVLYTVVNGEVKYQAE